MENTLQAKPLHRCSDQELSLWQSIVSEKLLKQEKIKTNNDKLTIANLQDHPVLKAVHEHVKDNDGQESISRAAFEQAITKIPQKRSFKRNEEDDDRQYSDQDWWNFLKECTEDYLAASVLNDGVLKYNSWKKEGENDLNYGVIDYKLSNDAKVAIIGDWGTGMEDAKYLLKTIMEQHKPEVVIHLGDIYYSGTASECEEHFAKIFTEVFDEVLGKGNRIPIFSIPGNHDYYAFGYPYYAMVDTLNLPHKEQFQPASFFCLRTQDEGWQFLGMDTSFEDSKPQDQINFTLPAPSIHDCEAEWHTDKLENFDGGSILLSHHQLFSANSKLNGSDSDFASIPYLNKRLLNIFQPYFGHKIGAWFWGHEHNQVMFDNNLFGLPKGRLVGASAYQEAREDKPYVSKFDSVPFYEDIKLKSTNGFFNHGYAVLDFSQRSTPKDKVVTEYYEYPSWEKTPNPIPTKASFMFSEEIEVSPNTVKKAITYQQEISINFENGVDYIGALSKGTLPLLHRYYPELHKQPVSLTLIGGTGEINDGDIVQIKTSETTAGDHNLLRGDKKYCYYDEQGDGVQQWMIKKVVQSDDSIIREDEAVYLICQEDGEDNYLRPIIPLTERLPIIKNISEKGTWLTADSKIKSHWFLKIK
jgi:DNA repair exonuclease SbcCD nuclease subunit